MRFIFVALLGVVALPIGLHAKQPAGPPLTLRLYDYAGAGTQARAAAAEETLGILAQTRVSFGIIDCAERGDPEICKADDRRDLLTARILRRALREAGPAAVGMTLHSENGTSAVLFYDRALDLSRPDLRAGRILGAALAHEVIHMLLPAESHTESGLMRPNWYSEDLRRGGGAWFWLSPHLIGSLRIEAARRGMSRDPLPGAVGPYRHERCSGCGRPVRIGPGQ